MKREWIILKKVGKSRDGHTLYDAQCSLCGFIYKKVKKSNLRPVSSCNHPIKRPMASKRLQHIYTSMISRCYKKTDKSFRFYGAKNITVCDDWKNNRNNFFYWAILSGYNEEMTIDRINEKLGYFPENCRWVSKEKNAKFKSTTRIIEIDGIKDSLSGWAKKFGIPKTTVVGWSKNKKDEEIIAYLLNKRNTNG